jgi:hypothetical protein
MQLKNIKYNNSIIYVVFTLIFIIGLVVYKDYGLTIDDEIYRKNGELYFEYIKLLLFTDIPVSIKDLSEKLIGPNNPFAAPILFELPLAFFSFILNKTTTKEIYTLSHLANFLIFYTSLFFFYKLVKKEFNSTFYGITSIILLFFTPRVFAESFYNSRDIFFLSIFIFYIYSVKIFLEKENFKSLIYLSLTSALLIYAKVVGIVPPIVFLFIYFLNSIIKNSIPAKVVKNIFLIILLIILFIFLLWPFLWDNPIKNLAYSFQSTISEQNNHSIITYYLGEYISSTNTPWHYRLVWFIITTPTLIVFFFLIGFIKILISMVKGILNIDKDNEDPWKNKDELFIFYLLFLLISIFFVVIKFNTSHFNSWRHLYFLYPTIILFSIFGFHFLKKILKNKFFSIFMYLLISLNAFYVFYWIYSWHPYQYIYFNLLSKNYAQKNFDLDYWGLSNINSIKYILKNNKKFPVKISTISYSSLNEGTLLLDEDEKKKIIIEYDIKNADFLIDNYMKNSRKNFIINSNEYIKYFEIIVDGTPINTVYKKMD